MVNTSLPNKYEKYLVIKEVDWHEKKIGYYHVSQIGCNHQELDQNDHSGPCLAATFMDYVNFIEQSIETKGNFKVGNLFHTEIEGNRKKNNPFCFPEFPLQKLFERDGQKLITMGSIDIPDQIPLTLEDDPKEPIWVDILDIKSASDYTFPKYKDHKNPTHFDQTKIYAYWLQNYYLNRKYIRVRNLYVVYAAKHNLYIGEQSVPYIDQECRKKFANFVSRCFYLHSKLLEWLKIIEDEGVLIPMDIDNNKRIRDKLNKISIIKEHHHWCKYDNYRHRCRDNVLFDDDIVEYTDSDIGLMYQKETGKNPMWRGNFTKAYLKFKDQFKVKL